MKNEYYIEVANYNGDFKDHATFTNLKAGKHWAACKAKAEKECLTVKIWKNGKPFNVYATKEGDQKKALQS